MDNYLIRRAILDGVESLEPGLCTIDDIAAHPHVDAALRSGSLTREKLFAEVQGLVERGYLSDGRPGREPLIGLTAKGRGQIDREEDLDEYVWNTQATRFHRK